MLETQFPEGRIVRQVRGVGPVTALAFVLTIEDPPRFPDGRTAAAYLGLVPRRDQSGVVDSVGNGTTSSKKAPKKNSVRQGGLPAPHPATAHGDRGGPHDKDRQPGRTATSAGPQPPRAQLNTEEKERLSP